MITIYIALANISMEERYILKGESITQDLYESLPVRLKNKFKTAAGSPDPPGRNEIIGDTDEEKMNREKLAAKDKDKLNKQGNVVLNDSAKTGNKIVVKRNRKGRF